MMGDGSVLPSKECSSSAVNPDFPGSSSTSGPPCPPGLLTSQGPPRSQASTSAVRKRTVFSQEQKLVLQEHFDECTHPSQEQCMALAQRFGVKVSHIKMWFKNRRARKKRENSQELPGEPGSGSHDRPACPQGSVPLLTSASADSVCQSPDLQNHPSTVSEPSLQMSQSPLIPPGVLMQSSLQGHSDHERIPRPPVSPDPSTKPTLQLLGTGTAHPRHQIPSSSSVSSGRKGSQVPVASSDKCSDQQVRPEAPRKQRKERTVYSEEQKVLLQRHFHQDMHPSLEKRTELALTIGVTEYEIKIWFKNQRAKNKKKNLCKSHEVMPESNASSKDASVPTHSPRHLPVPARADVERTSLDTSTVDFILPPTRSLQASLHDDQARDYTGYSPQEHLLQGQAPVEACNPGQHTVVESQLYPAVTEWATSMEASHSTTEGVHAPNNVPYLYPTVEQHWQRTPENLVTWEDSQTRNHILPPHPGPQAESLQSREEVVAMSLHSEFVRMILPNLPPVWSI